MQIRNTLIMAVVLIFVGGFVYFYEVRGRAEREEAERQEELLVHFDSEQVTALELTTTSGTESICAVRIPVIVFVAPGPEVTSTTPVFPVARENPSAMWVAPCSCRVSTNLIGESTNASKTGIAAPPG